MNNEVYLSYASFRLPGLSKACDISDSLLKKDRLPDLTQTILNNGQAVAFGELELGAEDEAMLPSLQDTKIMRKDVLAVTVCALEILKLSGLTKGPLTETPSFIASGAFIEGIFNQNNKVSRFFHQALKVGNDPKRREMMYRAVPPLMALNTLTNAASSYVAQYAHFAGHNATYGNTSLSGSYSLLSAWQEVRKHGKLALAGATNRGDTYSYLTFNRRFSKSDLWKESTCAALLLLSDKAHLEASGNKPLCIIEEIAFSSKVPSLSRQASFDVLETGDYSLGGSLIVFSGAYTREIYEQQKGFYESHSDDCFSWFPLLGNAGAVNMHLNILTAVEKLKHSRYDSAICIDKDPYQRESIVKVRLAD